MPDLRCLSSSYRWAFVPEVDTEGPAFPSDLEENHQECKPHTVRILELLKLKYGVNVFLFNSYICGRGEKGWAVSEVLHMLFDFNDFEQFSECLLTECSNLEMVINFIFVLAFICHFLIPVAKG